jgi:predicted nuclease of predicted toxin-antitoxin system
VRSKKQSAAKPPDGTVFFIDRSIGVEPIRTALVKAGLVVEVHDEHFARDEEDRVWLQAAGERGWVVLTKDQKLRYRPLEINALRESKARVFVLIAGNLRGVEIGAVFLDALPRICKVLYEHPGPFVARVSKSGKVMIGQVR